jgi:DNA-binding NarL/FixJ family response regulator
MKIVLVDHNPGFRNDLKFFLENQLHHTVIAEASSEEEFLELENFNDADIVLLDLFSGSMNGFEAAKIILEYFPRLKIIGITTSIKNVRLLKLIESGFKGFINKEEIYSALDNVIQSVYLNMAGFSNRFHIRSKHHNLSTG